MSSIASFIPIAISIYNCLLSVSILLKFSCVLVEGWLRSSSHLSATSVNLLSVVAKLGGMEVRWRQSSFDMEVCVLRDLTASASR